MGVRNRATTEPVHNHKSFRRFEALNTLFGRYHARIDTNARIALWKKSLIESRLHLLLERRDLVCDIWANFRGEMIRALKPLMAGYAVQS